jgi:type VI secretion system secreted protein Hcp
MAVVDYFLKIEGIEGESQDHKHKGEIELASFNLGAHQTGAHAAGGGGGAGKVSMEDVTFVMMVNKASPKMFLACANGQHIPNALLTCRKAGKEQQEYFKVKLTDVLISSCTIGGPHGGEVLPVNNVSLNFAKMEIEYKEQKADGSLGAATKAGWDLKHNKAF